MGVYNRSSDDTFVLLEPYENTGCFRRNDEYFRRW